MKLKGKNILVLGLGDTGLSAARWLKRRGAALRVADSRDDPPHAGKLKTEMPDVPLHTGPFRPASFQDIDLVVKSPGVPLTEPGLSDAVKAGVPVVGDIELFAQALSELKTQNPKLKTDVLAVSGTNGKTTVTALAGAMCREAGLKTAIAGNIGPPVLDALMKVEDRDCDFPQVWVLELSSFQLETTHTLNPGAATVLNLSEDHLDRYRDIAEYAAAKARIFLGNGIQVLNRNDPFSMGMALPGRRILRFGLDAPATAEDWGIAEFDGEPWLARGAVKLMPLKELRLAGLHNAANSLAALALCHAISLPCEPLLRALREFKGLPHRVQKVAEIRSVAFYDDSKGTNVGATVAALQGMAQKLVLIAGGDGKGQDFTPLREPVARRARAVVLLGRDREKIAAAIDGCGVPLFRADDMEQAVQISFAQARPNDAVLLSPACASFDMFRNYEHRAEVFVEAVRRLGKELGNRG